MTIKPSRLLLALSCFGVFSTTLLSMTVQARESAAAVDMEVVSSMTRIFPSSSVGKQDGLLIRIGSARNEYENAQLAVRSDHPIDINGLRIGKFVFQGGEKTEATPSCHVRVPENVFIEWNTRATPRNELDGVAPGWFPDPLPEADSFRLNGSRSIWISCHAPEAVVPGLYTGSLYLNLGSDKVKVPIEYRVWHFSLPEQPSMNLSIWPHHRQTIKTYGLRRRSPEFWNAVDEMAVDMFAHRQTHVFTSLELIKTTITKNGNYHFDFSDYRKWISIFQRRGLNYFEGRPLFNSKSHNIQDSRTGKRLRFDKEWLGTDQGKQYLRQYLGGLHAENQRLGLQGRYLQHVGDEAKEPADLSLYRQLASIVRQEMPGVPIIDATHLPASKRKHLMDIPVTSLGAEPADPANSQARRYGRWWYTAAFKPRGQYPNRFIDYPLIKNRVIPWLNWKMDISGYLHYAYNHWLLKSGKSPWEQVQKGKYAAGDAWIVYPSRTPGDTRPVPSMRWEVLRDGLEDYEYLVMLQSYRYYLEESLEGGQSSTISGNLETVTDLLHEIRGLFASRTRYPRNVDTLEGLRNRMGETLDRLVRQYGQR